MTTCSEREELPSIMDENLKLGDGIPKPPTPSSEEDIISAWKGDCDVPLVSVVCITFNQEKYIKDGLDSFLSQKTDFPFEVIVHDDCSTDRTRNIIEDYAKRYPKIIKPVLQTENQFSQGKRPTFLASKYTQGRYIALCEGDDYWIDDAKLAKQLEFLDKHSEYSATTHQTIKFFEDNRSRPEFFTEVEKEHWEIDDLMFGRKYHTASLMVRGDIFRENQIPEDIVSGDKAISFLLLSYGKIKYSSEPMAVYRKNPGGISSWVTAEAMAGDLNLIPWLRNINPNFPITKYRAIIHSTICSYPPKIRFSVALKNYLLFCLYSFSYFPRNLKQILGLARNMIFRIFRGGFKGI